MAWTAPVNITPGEVGSSVKMNEQVFDNLRALRSMTQVSKSGATSGLITFDTEVVDDFANFTAPLSYVTAPWAGRFETQLYVEWSGATGTGTCDIWVQRFNSSDVLQETVAADTASVSAWTFRKTVSGVCVASADDRFKVTVTTSASGSAGTTFSRLTVRAAG